MSKGFIYTIIVIALVAAGWFLFYDPAPDNNTLAPASEDQASSTAVATDEETPTSQPVTDTADTTTPTPAPATPTNQVRLAENDTSSVVTVASATLTEPGYVVLYQVNSQDRVSEVGSSELLSPDTYSNLRVQLRNPVVKEQVLVAVLYADNGDGTFNADAGDTYLSGDSAIVFDVDVIDVPAAEESDELRARAAASLR